MDGTLMDSSVEVMMCLERAFEAENIEIDKRLLTSNIIGPPMDGIVRSVKNDISKKQCDKVIDTFRKFYDENDLGCARLYDGVFETLTFLKEQGKRLFIATYKPTQPALHFAKKFKLDMFEDIYTLDKVEGKEITKTFMISDILEKYSLDAKKSVMIGDAIGDVTSAKDNGVFAVAALWGYGDNKQPLLDVCDFAADDIADLEILSFTKF
jgi:phosphoglycolate phosphatase